MRVVSCTCSNTEIVCALGRASDLVGIDDYSDYPTEVVERLPRVGPDLGIDPLKVVALEPDLVLASLTVPGHEQVVAQLEATGLRVLAPAPTSVDDVYDDIRTIALALGVSESGERLAREMATALEPRSARSPRPSILVQWWPKPVIAPGRQSWVQDLLERAGARNPLGAEEVKSRPMSDDEVRTLAPDAFVLSWCGVEPHKVRPDVVYRNPLWQGLEALREQRVYLVPEALLGRPGPRLVEGYRELQRIVDEISPLPDPGAG